MSKKVQKAFKGKKAAGMGTLPKKVSKYIDFVVLKRAGKK